MKPELKLGKTIKVDPDTDETFSVEVRADKTGVFAGIKGRFIDLPRFIKKLINRRQT